MEQEGAPANPAVAGRPGSAVVASEVFEARRAARALREEAEAEARALREAARADVEAVRAEARAAGHAEGLARAAGELLRAAEHRDRVLAALREEVVDLGLALAARILERELRAGDDVLAMAERALEVARDRRRVVVRASPPDLEALRRAGPGRLGGRAVRLAADPGLGRGEVVVETEVGEVDGRLSTQLDVLRRVLAEEGC
jgi:flagellar biosynthesis/type III secretory pathway protein FliH